MVACELCKQKGGSNVNADGSCRHHQKMKMDVLVYEIPKDLPHGKSWRTDSKRREDLDFQVDAINLSDAADKARERMRDGKVICITRFFRDECVQLYFQ